MVPVDAAAPMPDTQPDTTPKISLPVSRMSEKLNKPVGSVRLTGSPSA
jgi:hypothetical protein